MNYYELPQQRKQHEKEERFIDFLKDYCPKHGISFVDCHRDINFGADVYINGEPYDLKVSNKRLITVVKVNNYTGRWELPLLEHRDIPYLIVEDYDDKFVVFKLRKDQIEKEWKNPLRHKTVMCYNKKYGDGNYNECQDVSRLMEIAGPEMVFHKGN